MLHEHRFDSVRERRLLSLVVTDAHDLRSRFELPMGNFVCLLAWDATNASDDTVVDVATRLLSAGACYFVCWGPDCERVHDLIDAVICDPDNPGDLPPRSFVMTTWHNAAPLEEAIWYFLVNTWPDESYEETTHTAVAVTIASTAWGAEIATALDDPQFVSRVANRESR